MLSILLPSEFNHSLVVLATIGLSSLICCEIVDTSVGNKAFLSGLFERDKIKGLKLILAAESVNREIKRQAQNQLDSIAYKYTTGIKADKVIQGKIIDCVKLSKGRLDYCDFKKALPFLQVAHSGDLKVREIKLRDRLI